MNNPGEGVQYIMASIFLQFLTNTMSACQLGLRVIFAVRCSVAGRNHPIVKHTRNNTCNCSADGRDDCRCCTSGQAPTETSMRMSSDDLPVHTTCPLMTRSWSMGSRSCNVIASTEAVTSSGGRMLSAWLPWLWGTGGVGWGEKSGGQ
jgi:hypothetical protein